MLTNILQSRLGIIIISIIWGLGLSTLFRRSCQGKRCHLVVYRGPDPNQIEKTYYDYGTGHCYQYYPVITQC